MPDPDKLFGGLSPGDPEFSNYLYKMGGDDFWNELTDYQGRRSSSGPRAGYNYRTKKPRDEKVAADLQSRLDALYDHWRVRGWSPLDDPSGKQVIMKDELEYSGGLPSTVGEADKMLEQILTPTPTPRY